MIKASKIGVSYLINSVKEIFNKDKNDKVQGKVEKMKVLRKTFEQYGGLLAKIAQMLSFGDTSASAFSNLQPFSRDKTHKYLLEYIKKENLIYTIIPTIFKSGSIGQVYKGMLNGKQIILKLKYRGLDKQTDEDIRVVNMVAKFIYNAKSSNLSNGLEEIKNTITRELNFELETKEHENIYSIWDGIEYVNIPKVYTNLSNKDFIIMDFIDGEDILQFSKNCSQEEKNKIGYDLVRFIFTSMYEYNILYSDVHYGNFIITRNSDGVPCLNVIDFGCIHHIDRKTYKNFKKIHKYVKKNDKEKFIKYATKLGILQDSVSKEAKDYCYKVFQSENEPWIIEKEFTFTQEWLKKTHEKDFKLLSELYMPKEMVYFNRIPHGVFHILTHLNVTAPFYKIFNELISTDEDN